MHTLPKSLNATLPDLRDGLTRLERVIIVQLQALERERPGHIIGATMLYGRVVELVDVGQPTFMATLRRLQQLRYPLVSTNGCS